jgi:hypothetical protein
MAKKNEVGYENPNNDSLESQGQYEMVPANREQAVEIEADKPVASTTVKTGAINKAPLKATPDSIKTVITGLTQNPNLVEGKKTFVFNQTGNIMVSTTQDPSLPVSGNVMDVFNEVSVFFAAMAKAITSTINPLDPNKQPYSIFNYDALEKVINGSGCFVEITKEVVNYTSNSFGMSFSKDLLTALLGLPGTGAMAFAASLVASVGDEGLKISADKSSSSSKAGSIVFVCEYLMGMPIVTATCLYTDSSTVVTAVNIGPCVKTSSIQTKMDIYKDVYYFVTPSLIKKYAPDLDTLIGNSEYGEFISFLEAILQGKCYVEGIYDSTGKTATTTLTQESEYIIKGSGFGISGFLQLNSKDGAFTISNWNDLSIKLTVTSTASTEGNELEILDSNRAILARESVKIAKKS